jgi:hypothetical protein
MNRPLKLLALVGALSLIPLMATMACPPPYCDNCHYWDGEECADLCLGCCFCSSGSCLYNDSYCSWTNPCYYCSGCWCTCDAVVTGVSVSGPYCVGASATVSCSVGGSVRPRYCYISWSCSPAGAVSFSPNPSSAASTTATFVSPGAGVTISASTSCPNGGATSSPFDIVALTQILSMRDGQCVNTQFSFMVVTNPTGYEDRVTWSTTDDLASPSTGTGQEFKPRFPDPGTPTVYATLFCGQSLSKEVRVAVPTNMVLSGPPTYPGEGVLEFTYTWGSTSGITADLNGCYVGERVDYPGGNPYLWPNPPWSNGTPNPTEQPNYYAWAAESGAGVDQQLHGSLYPPYATASFSASQQFKYQDGLNNRATLMGPHSISRSVTQEGPYWRYEVTKHGYTGVWFPLP